MISRTACNTALIEKVSWLSKRAENLGMLLHLRCGCTVGMRKIKFLLSQHGSSERTITVRSACGSCETCCYLDIYTPKMNGVVLKLVSTLPQPKLTTPQLSRLRVSPGQSRDFGQVIPFLTTSKIQSKNKIEHPECRFYEQH